MCGRFVGFRKLEELEKYFPIDRSDVRAAANYNITPSQEILALVRCDRENVLDLFHWGLVPFWAKNISMGNRLINARAETVASKPSFRTAFKKRRCLILADGFYEWKNVNGKKEPYFMTLPDENPFAFAGFVQQFQHRAMVRVRSRHHHQTDSRTLLDRRTNSLHLIVTRRAAKVQSNDRQFFAADINYDGFRVQLIANAN